MLHLCCNDVAPMLHPCCVYVAMMLHPCCIDVTPMLCLCCAYVAPMLASMLHRYCNRPLALCCSSASSHRSACCVSSSRTSPGQKPWPDLQKKKPWPDLQKKKTVARSSPSRGTILSTSRRLRVHISLAVASKSTAACIDRHLNSRGSALGRCGLWGSRL